MKYVPECPIPQTDFDVITLGHGSGGLLTNKLLDAGVFTLFDSPELQLRHDGAILTDLKNPVFTTDSFVVSPIFFPGGDIGDLAVNGTVNDIVMCGGIPQYLSLSFILEEGLTITEFWQVLTSIKAAADHAGVRIVTGDTKVVEKGKGDKIFINTTGLGEKHPKVNVSTKHLKAGDKLIVSGPIANHGIAILSVREGLVFETEVKSDTRSLAHIGKKLFDQYGKDIKLMRDPTRGGVATVFAEIARDSKWGIDVWKSTFSIDRQVDAACELLGLDPFYVANEGIFIAIVSGEIANDFVDILRKQEGGERASIVGEIVNDHPGKVVIENELGGRNVLNMLPGDQLPRIC